MLLTNRSGWMPSRLGQKLHFCRGTCSRMCGESLLEFLKGKRFDLEFLQTHLRQKAHRALMRVRVDERTEHRELAGVDVKGSHAGRRVHGGATKDQNRGSPSGQGNCLRKGDGGADGVDDEIKPL